MCVDCGCCVGIFTSQVFVVCLVESVLTSEYYHSHTMHYLCHTSGSVGDIWCRSSIYYHSHIKC